MNAIVFDDLNTPHFRHRKDTADDDTKALEEFAKKPMTIHLVEGDNGTELTPKVNNSHANAQSEEGDLTI
jgi:hypothetical protein